MKQKLLEKDGNSFPGCTICIVTCNFKLNFDST